jgi:hypothetical protein
LNVKYACSFTWQMALKLHIGHWMWNMAPKGNRYSGFMSVICSHLQKQKKKLWDIYCSHLEIQNSCVSFF